MQWNKNIADRVLSNCGIAIRITAVKYTFCYVFVNDTIHLNCNGH